jgi:hypothetical protein
MLLNQIPQLSTKLVPDIPDESLSIFLAAMRASGQTVHKYREKLRYMHRNSVTRGLASKPEDWRWSSLRHAISSLSLDSSLSDEVNRQSYFSKDMKSSPSAGSLP